MNRTFKAALFVAAMALPTSALAGPMDEQIAVIKVHDGDNAGLGAPNQNNRQTGAGMEHVSMAVVKNAPGGPALAFCGTASYTDIPGSPITPANSRVQMLCGTYRLDATLGLQSAPTFMKYITENNNNQYQNGHKPKVVSVLGGTAFAVFYGYDPDNNTDTWVQVFDTTGQRLVPQTRIIQNNNDDLGGAAREFVTKSDSSNKTCLVGSVIGNGNGNDDSWVYEACIEKTAEGYTAAQMWRENVILAEERSRGVLAPTTIPGRVLYCGTAGDTQPPNLGVVCSLINTEPNVQDRVVWKKFVAQREGQNYKTTADVLPIYDASGNLTNEYIVGFVNADTSERNGREKAKTTVYQVPIEISDTTMTLLDAPRADATLTGAGAHPNWGFGNWGDGQAAGPASFLIQGSIIDSPQGIGRLAIMRYDAATKKLVKSNEVALPVATGMGMISQKFGNNPQTPQGRGHHDVIMMENPGFGLATGFMPNVKQFMVMGNVGPTLRQDGTLAQKAGFSIVMVPAVTASAASGTPPEPPAPPPTPEEEEEEVKGNASGGCSTSGSPATGLALALGAAVALVRRRRK
jgi:uncharacterized protein (TIGR03382 family)